MSRWRRSSRVWLDRAATLEKVASYPSDPAVASIDAAVASLVDARARVPTIELKRKVVIVGVPRRQRAVTLGFGRAIST